MHEKIWQPCSISLAHTNTHFVPRHVPQSIQVLYVLWKYDVWDSLVLKAQVGGNSFLNSHRQPDTHTQKHISTSIMVPGPGQARHDSTALTNPSLRSTAPTSQLSSPNTLHGISVLSTICSLDSNLFIFTQKCALFGVHGNKWAFSNKWLIVFLLKLAMTPFIITKLVTLIMYFLNISTLLAHICIRDWGKYSLMFWRIGGRMP